MPAVSSPAAPQGLKQVAGYLHPLYAESLAEFGTPRALPRSGGWVLERQIPGFPFRDAMGCYPLFACRDWSGLAADLGDLGDGMVSLALVVDPFAGLDAASLARCFEVVRPFKEHFVVDLRRPAGTVPSKHHRKYARRALRAVRVERCETPIDCLEEWTALYSTLTERHRLTGMKAFSRPAFAKQLGTPGGVVFRAVARGETVGIDWYFVQGEVVYAHLAAFSPAGYDLSASYALQWCAIEYFAGRASWLDLGACAGVGGTGGDGLSLFKRGWATGTRPAYFCGRVFDPERYAAVVKARGGPATEYFPAYRQGEFGEPARQARPAPERGARA
jgi:hypothetical protein